MHRIAAVVFFVWLARADVRQCNCDLAEASAIQARECSLCREAEMRSAGEDIFFLKDVNPRKPNRWLALPRAHAPAQHSLTALAPGLRAALWAGAIEKAKSLWGNDWGLAVNGELARTQCHTHVHIGKLLQGIETSNFVVVNGPAEIPAPEDGSGLWVHPVGGNLHVHLKEAITETVLLR